MPTLSKSNEKVRGHGRDAQAVVAPPPLTARENDPLQAAACHVANGPSPDGGGSEVVLARRHRFTFQMHQLLHTAAAAMAITDSQREAYI